VMHISADMHHDVSPRYRASSSCRCWERSPDVKFSVNLQNRQFQIVKNESSFSLEVGVMLMSHRKVPNANEILEGLGVGRPGW
jgi:hypothetical protein